MITKPTEPVYNVMKKNLNDFPDIKWQYFGSEKGEMVIYPSNKNCDKNYDPRFRPWYVEASNPKIKDVVLVIDTSGKKKLSNTIYVTELRLHFF